MLFSLLQFPRPRIVVTRSQRLMRLGFEIVPMSPLSTDLTKVKHGAAAACVFLCASVSVGSAWATDFAVGGAWGNLEENAISIGVEATAEDANLDLPVSFTAPTDTLTNPELTIGYTLPAFGTFNLDADEQTSSWSTSLTPSNDPSLDGDGYGSFATSVFGGQVGVFGGMTDQQNAFALETTTSRTIGASVGYAGFYLSGAYQDAGPDVFLEGRRAWQAGLGFGSGDFDVRVTYVQSAFAQGGPTELEGKQWMIGGLVQLTPSILLNANAFIIDRELAMPTVEPPGTGARVGVQLRF